MKTLQCWIGFLSICSAFAVGCGQMADIIKDVTTTDDINEIRQSVSYLAKAMHIISNKVDNIQAEYQQGMKSLDLKIDSILVNRQKASVNDSSLTAIRSIFGCTQDVITITCSSGNAIAINEAHFGQYSDRTCPSVCCGPHPTDDCVESLQQEAPLYWDSLITTCNYKTSCNFEVPLYSLSSCISPSETEYLEILYTCSPQTIEKGIGFTATITADVSLSIGKVIKFINVVTNVGGHFNSSTSVFMCPVSGTYVFSTTIRIVSGSSSYDASIMHEGTIVTTVASAGYNYDVGSTTAVVVCNSGERVWVESQDSFTIDGSTFSWSSFSGFLLMEYI